jgi:ComF family protein
MSSPPNPYKSSKSWFSDIGQSLLHLAFPHICQGCGTDVIDTKHQLCIRCLAAMPRTDFQKYSENPIERIFWGRLTLETATAQYYFTKESGMQHLMHQFKYRGNKELGLYLGQLMGQALFESNRFSAVDALVPLPLYGSKERSRGFNQALVLCQGMAQVWTKPILPDVVIRKAATESQTRKNRIERWQNMEGRFEVINAAALENKHILLVDDVLTTGATLEACGRELCAVPGTTLSIATLCFASNI